MSNRDHYYNKAKQEGYRARSAYKLKQIDEAAGVLGPGRTVVDLGAAPGGWLQVAAERVGDRGSVVGVDRQRIQDLEDTHGANVETVRGDMTDADTRERVVDLVGEADVVLSDMAPNMSGDYDLDHARSVHLARQAFETAQSVLGPGGDFVAKVFDGRDLDAFEADLEEHFEYVRRIRPEASRDESSELFLVGKHYLTAPVTEGDELTVTIEDVGSEGDGVAKVDGYTLFVSGAEEGEELAVRVTDVKANFGFAERVD